MGCLLATVWNRILCLCSPACPSFLFPVSPSPHGPPASPAPRTTNLEVVLAPTLLLQAHSPCWASSAVDTRPLPKALLLLIKVVGPPPLFSLLCDDFIVMCLSLAPLGRLRGLLPTRSSPLLAHVAAVPLTPASASAPGTHCPSVRPPTLPLRNLTGTLGRVVGVGEAGLTPHPTDKLPCGQPVACPCRGCWREGAHCPVHTVQHRSGMLERVIQSVLVTGARMVFRRTV